MSETIKKTILLSCFLIGLLGFSQSEKPIDLQTQAEKEDPLNIYNQNKITTLDVLEALELASIRIHKFDIGTFEKEYVLQIFADEYVDGKLIKTDTLLDYTNDYGFTVDDEIYQGFIDQIKIFTKTEENYSELNIRTYAMGTTKEINLPKTDDRQFFNWRAYDDTKWKLNEKVPLLIFASSWLDEQYNFHRFCGVAILNENDERTQELLDFSPNYIVINYKISEKQP